MTCNYCGESLRPPAPIIHTSDPVFGDPMNLCQPCWLAILKHRRNAP